VVVSEGFYTGIRGWKGDREVVYGVKELVFPEWDLWLLVVTPALA
jgi:hypothetical protein